MNAETATAKETFLQFYFLGITTTVSHHCIIQIVSQWLYKPRPNNKVSDNSIAGQLGFVTSYRYRNTASHRLLSIKTPPHRVPQRRYNITALQLFPAEFLTGVTAAKTSRSYAVTDSVLI
jgi:hypothetical protein